MTLENKLNMLGKLAKTIDLNNPEIKGLLNKVSIHNPWFSIENQQKALSAICQNYLSPTKLRNWLKKYEQIEIERPKKTVGLVMAGNIPLVGFHDFLCVFLAGHKAQIKLSSKDDILIKYLFKQLEQIDPNFTQHYEVVDLLKGFDAIIATGSNNSSRYFEYYFKKYPHIIRKNRNSVAILDGQESAEDLQQLAIDVFSYFGLGCRNVSKLYVPQDYDFTQLLDNWENYQYLINHNKYKNNYDYKRSVMLLNREEHLASDFVMLKENNAIVSPISVVYYEYYKDDNEWQAIIKERENEIQCVLGNAKGLTPLGQAQSPALSDYADGVDTMEFLSSL